MNIMEQVYKIAKFDLIGAVLYTKELLPNVRVINENNKQRFIDETGKEYPKSHLWELTTQPNKEAAYSTDEKFLPYQATVIEDLPTRFMGFSPKVYKGCMLMTEKHGGYLQFFHEPTKEVLRIAINSHNYQPENN